MMINKQNFHVFVGWFKKEVISKLIAKHLIYLIILLLSVTGFWIYKTVPETFKNVFVIDKLHTKPLFWLIILVIIFFICLVTTLVISIFKYNKLKRSFFDNECQAFLSLSKAISKADKEIKLIGHACTNVFYLEDKYKNALNRGVDIKVLLVNPISKKTRLKKVYLKEEELDRLISHIDGKEKIPDDILDGLTNLSTHDFVTKIPIILSLVYGWWPIYRNNYFSRKNNSGSLELKLYSHSDYYFKAVIIDNKTCFFGNYNLPVDIQLINRIYKDIKDDDSKAIISTFEKLQNLSTTKSFDYQIRTLLNRELKKIAQVIQLDNGAKQTETI